MVDIESRIKNLKKEIERLRELVYRDELTGLLNRRAILEISEKIFKTVVYTHKEFKKRRTFGVPLCVLFFDIDNFKEINDRFGHAGGDAVLKEAARRSNNTLRKSDIFGRWGGEEFMVTLLGVDEESAMIVADHIRQALEKEPFKIDGVEIPFTASFGIASYKDQDSFEEIVAEADKAMYHAKKNLGKNAVARYSEIE